MRKNTILAGVDLNRHCLKDCQTLEEHLGSKVLQLTSRVNVTPCEAELGQHSIYSSATLPY